ncbi:MAG: hypothetical protein K0R38_2182 [Polyangiaceae bacterium]|jgi:MscS family membrane protein|nr:hypothetical protein [Polyangiaceae bacterium]
MRNFLYGLPPLAILTLTLLVWPCNGFAQAPPPDAGERENDVVLASPRAALLRYLELARAGRYGDAGAFLDVPPERASERVTLARQLRAVLDRASKFDPEAVSEQAEGNLNDGLPPAFEQVAVVKGVDGAEVPVRMSRAKAGAPWRFSRTTSSKISGWYDALPDRWFLEHLPSALLREGPRGLLWWQWLGLLSSLLVGWLSGALLGRLLRKGLGAFVGRTSAQWDDRLLARLAGPLTSACAIGVVRLLLPQLLLYADAETFVEHGLRGAFLATILWAVWRVVDVSAEAAWDSSWSLQHPASRALIPLLRRAGQAVVAVSGVLLFLSTLGYAVTSILAGLGIGGLALALASQKTVENLFGAFSLGIDQPFREGDFVRVDDVVGTVESLGLRSTKIRTLDRTLVSIPNGKLAEMKLETFAVRDRLRLACTVGLEYSTSVQQMRAVLRGLEAALRAHPKIWTDSIVVRFKELAASSLDIEVMAWFSTSDWSEFQGIREEILLSFMTVVEEEDCSFAFPTRTVHVVSEPASAGERAA